MENDKLEEKVYMYDFYNDTDEWSPLTNVYFTWDIAVRFVISRTKTSSNDVSQKAPYNHVIRDLSTFVRKIWGKGEMGAQTKKYIH